MRTSITMLEKTNDDLIEEVKVLKLQQHQAQLAEFSPNFENEIMVVSNKMGPDYLETDQQPSIIEDEFEDNSSAGSQKPQLEDDLANNSLLNNLVKQDSDAPTPSGQSFLKVPAENSPRESFVYADKSILSTGGGIYTPKDLVLRSLNTTHDQLPEIGIAIDDLSVKSK